jgi:hypothetical protein
MLNYQHKDEGRPVGRPFPFQELPRSRHEEISAKSRGGDLPYREFESPSLRQQVHDITRENIETGIHP